MATVVYPPDVDVTYQGTLKAAKLALPADAVGDTQVDTARPISAAKLEHQHCKQFAQAHGTAATSERRVVHAARAAGSLTEVRAGLSVVCAGAATVTIQVLKNGTNVLTSTLQLDNTTAIFTSVLGVFSATTYVAGDVFEVSTTATAGGGTLGQGVYCAVTFTEASS
jgi:hypothetical protein